MNQEINFVIVRFVINFNDYPLFVKDKFLNQYEHEIEKPTFETYDIRFKVVNDNVVQFITNLTQYLSRSQYKGYRVYLYNEKFYKLETYISDDVYLNVQIYPTTLIVNMSYVDDNYQLQRIRKSVGMLNDIYLVFNLFENQEERSKYLVLHSL